MGFHLFKGPMEIFTEKHQSILDKAIEDGMEYTDLDAPIKLFLGCGIAQVLENDEIYEPHQSYFPWATKRQIYKTTKKLIEYLARNKHLLVTVTSKHSNIYDLWEKHGYCRKVGVFRNLSFGDKHIYQVEKWV